MKRNIEDKLIELAFGDLEPKEAAQLELQAKGDPEALRVLASYRDMKDGLRNLADVPADQLSKDRLRDAILGQGLKPHPPRPSWRDWVWMPVTACLVAFGLVLYQNSQSPSTPMIVMNDAQPKVEDPLFTAPKNDLMEPAVPDRQHNVSEPVESVTSSESQPDPVPQRRSVQPKGVKRQTPPREKRTLVAKNEPGEHIGLGNGLIYIPSPAAERAPSGSAESGTLAGASLTAKEEPSSSGPIVLIGQQEDWETGALRATEVGEFSNVVVGG